MKMFTFGYKSKFSSILRALAAIGIGLVMVFGNNATELVVKIIASFLFAAGVVSFAYGWLHKKDGALSLMTVNAVVDILIGLLLYFFPQQVASLIVYIIGAVLVLFGVLQLVVLSGTMRLLGRGFGSLTLSIIAIVGGIVLLFNPFTVAIMSIIAGTLLIMYGGSELLSAWHVEKAKAEYDIRFPSQDSKPEPNDVQVAGGSSIEDAKEVEFRKIDD